MKCVQALAHSDLLLVWPGFNINVQQDAHEFLLKLLEQVRHDFCRETKLSVEEVDIHKYPLGTVFAGWLQTSGFCKCTRSTKVYELVDHLNLPLCTSVQEALRKFTNTEEVNDFKCPSCDSINSYSRKIDILHEPEVLILQLKRFDSSTDEKCDDCVTIDMDIVINEASFTFVSCVAHLGPSRKNGHYICITRCPDGSFVQFNDHNVSKTLCAPLSLMSRNGYLIFYKRNPVESKLPQSLGSLLVRNEPLATSTPNKVTPLKIKRRHRQGPKETSFQSSNIYELQAKSSRKQLFNDEPSSPALNQDGLKRSKGTVTPIKILRRKRKEPKETSLQSSHIYDLQTKKVKGQVPTDEPHPSSPVNHNHFQGTPVKITPIKIKKRKREEPKENSQQSSHIYEINSKPLEKSKKNCLRDKEEDIFGLETEVCRGVDRAFEEDILGPESDVCHAVGRSFKDVVLLPNEVPGATLPYAEVKKNSMDDLRRWLECYGFSKLGIKDQLVSRVENVIRIKGNRAVDPQLDEGRWYTQKKNTQQTTLVASQPTTFPTSGWDTFPSIQIPNMFNYGHIYFYLIESMPVYSDPSLSIVEDSDSGFSDEESNQVVDPFADDAGSIQHCKKIRRGMVFLKSGHVRKVENTSMGAVYFVRAQVRASMRMDFYNVQVAISTMSGNVKICTCTCKQQALGRCSHVSATLLFMWCHIQLNGYDGKSSAVS
ncbi:ubiquitin carboxyl-terminal hydrolase 36-like [Frankliniella occidentalis]|uniref:Ubiquitin carboxyl-terminal hydrolase 36-like n=1 Tax=Frankliniella occidentalis TaxID=133901 RepID=A0A6J1T7E3_FRAOC|nr:ubiquitin carboxyl-terminal hydrolase 36-like [Frankliniella occidentalis]